jgi:signal peptidase I
MLPYLRKGDRVLAIHMKFSGPPKRGDSVFFRTDTPHFLIKRVIGLPGETLMIVNGKVLVDDKKIVDFVDDPSFISNYGPAYIPSGHYFLLADYRSIGIGLDSRKYGNVPLSKILYKALAIYWPPHHFQILI